MIKMNKKMNNLAACYYKNEQGVALLMTLGILALLMVMALSFAFAAMNSQKSVDIAQDIVKSRLQAESGFKQAFSLLTANFSDPNYPQNLFPATVTMDNVFGPTTQTSDWDDRVYWASKEDSYYASDADETANTPSQDRSGIDTALHIVIAGIDFTPDVALDDTFGWLHVYDTSERYIDDTDTPIISRVAFLIIDESGKIDPAPTTESGITEGTEKRFGITPTEINISNVTNTNLASHLRRGDTDGIAADEKWQSHYQMFKQLLEDSVYVTGSVDTDADMKLIKANLFPHSYDKEAYFDGDDDKHRFNLARSDWDSLGITDILKAAELWKTGSQDSSGIPWLGISTDTALNNQIAANLIDYCDSNADAESDYAGSGAVPTYCGNDEYYYINEVEIKANLFGDTITLTFDVELVNMYSIAAAVSSNLFVKGTIDGTEFAAVNFDNGTGLTINPSGNYFEATSIGIVTTTVADPDDDGDSENVTLSNLVVYLENSVDSTKLKDFAQLPNPTTSRSLNALFTNNQIIYYAANDPRYNLATDGWTQGQTWGDSVNAKATPGALNHADFCNPNPGGSKDSETGVTEPSLVSTAYIRNGPMETLWELGAIHRGAPWETINLKAYKPVTLWAMRTPDALLGTYSDGDANILSQVKIGSDTEATGYINVNTYNEDVLIALLEGVKVGDSSYDEASPDGTAITGGVAGTAKTMVGSLTTPVTNTILSANSADGAGSGETFQFRGQLANALKLSDGSVVTQTNDRRKEEIIGKIIGLTTVRQNYFSIIAVSQIVRDLVTGVGGSGGERGHFNEGIDTAYADQILMAIIYRDALRNTVEVLRYEYLDE